MRKFDYLKALCLFGMSMLFLQSCEKDNVHSIIALDKENYQQFEIAKIKFSEKLNLNPATLSARMGGELINLIEYDSGFVFIVPELAAGVHQFVCLVNEIEYKIPLTIELTPELDNPEQYVNYQIARQAWNKAELETICTKTHAMYKTVNATLQKTILFNYLGESKDALKAMNSKEKARFARFVLANENTLNSSLPCYLGQGW